MKKIKPILNFAPEILLKAQEIKLAFLSIDGFLNKNFNFYSQDIFGIKLLLQAKILPVIVNSEIYKDNSFDELTKFGIIHKVGNLKEAETLLKKLKNDWSKTACLTFDWSELKFMQKCRFSFVPKDAHLQNQDLTDFISNFDSGEGAVRQFCDLLLVASNKYKEFLN